MGYDYVPLYLSMGLPGNRFPKLKSRWANFFDFSLLCPTTTIPKNVFNYYWFILLKELGGPNEITGGLPIGEPWCRGMWEIPRPLMMYLWCFVPVTAPAPACMRWVTSSSQPPVSLADYRHSSRAWPGRPDNESNTGTSECLCQPCLPALLLPTCLCTLLYWLSLCLCVTLTCVRPPGCRRRRRRYCSTAWRVWPWGICPRSPVSDTTRWSPAAGGCWRNAPHSWRASGWRSPTSTLSCRTGTCASPGTGRAEGTGPGDMLQHAWLSQTECCAHHVYHQATLQLPHRETNQPTLTRSITLSFYWRGQINRPFHTIVLNQAPFPNSILRLSS